MVEVKSIRDILSMKVLSFSFFMSEAVRSESVHGFLSAMMALPGAVVPVAGCFP